MTQDKTKGAVRMYVTRKGLEEMLSKEPNGSFDGSFLVYHGRLWELTAVDPHEYRFDAVEVTNEILH